MLTTLADRYDAVDPDQLVCGHLLQDRSKRSRHNQLASSLQDPFAGAVTRILSVFPERLDALPEHPKCQSLRHLI